MMLHASLCCLKIYYSRIIELSIMLSDQHGAFFLVLIGIGQREVRQEVN